MPERIAHRDENFPWSALPSAMATWLRPELSSIAEEVIAAIRREVPEYARPMEGRFAAMFRQGVAHTLNHFVTLVEAPHALPPDHAKVFRDLGRGEHVESRSLDALQAAYRVGARVAWRRYARIARRARLSPELTGTLAEAVFIHLHGIVAESAKGYAEAQASAAGTLQHRRQRLLESLLAEPPIAEEVAGALAQHAQWPIPAGVACVAIETAADGDRFEPPALPSFVLVSTTDTDPFLLVPDPGSRHRESLLRKALGDRLAVLGPTVPPMRANRSLRWARRALRLAQRGVLPRKPLLNSADHLGDLLLLTDENLARMLADRTISAFAGMRPDQCERLESTLLAWLTSKARSAPEVATKLGIHPQTLRYRMHQLTELFGDRLYDPDFRFETEAALRSRALLCGTETVHDGMLAPDVT
jgi:hypothetical protein